MVARNFHPWEGGFARKGPGMHPDASAELLEARSTRRVIVRGAARLAYAAPVVAATLALQPTGAGAECSCAFGTVEVTRRADPNRGRCATCPPGHRYRPLNSDCKRRRSIRPATYSAKVCSAVSGA